MLPTDSMKIVFSGSNKRIKAVFYFLIPAGILLIGFLISQLLFKPDVWSKYLWIPEIGMVLTYAAIFIMCYERFIELKRRRLATETR